METVCSAPYQQGPNDPQRTYVPHSYFRENGSVADAPKGVVCWHDLHPFSGDPVHLPMEFHESNGKYAGLGFFCSTPCAKRWAIEHPTFNSPHQMTLLAQAYGFTQPVKPALPQIRLQVMGGDLDIVKFRELSGCGLEVVVHQPPFITWAMVFEERRIRESNTDGASDTVPTITTFPGVKQEEERTQIRGLRVPSEPMVAEQIMDADIYQPTPPMYDQFLEMKQSEKGSSEKPVQSAATAKGKGSSMKAPTVKRQKTKPTTDASSTEGKTKTSSAHVNIAVPKPAATDLKRGSLQAFMKLRSEKKT